MSDTKPLGNADKLGAVLKVLAETIDMRADAGDATGSYTANLLAKGPAKVAKKIIEEGGELGLALVSETDEAVASEAADVLYHVLVGLRARGIALNQISDILADREGISGLEEKARRAE